MLKNQEKFEELDSPEVQAIQRCSASINNQLRGIRNETWLITEIGDGFKKWKGTWEKEVGSEVGAAMGTAEGEWAKVVINPKEFLAGNGEREMGFKDWGKGKRGEEEEEGPEKAKAADAAMAKLVVDAVDLRNAAIKSEFLCYWFLPFHFCQQNQIWA